MIEEFIATERNTRTGSCSAMLDDERCLLIKSTTRRCLMNKTQISVEEWDENSYRRVAIRK